MTDASESIDLDELRKLALAATPGPWERGDHWHIQGSDSCQCSERHGPLVEERQMNINGTMMDAHVHRSEKPWWEHGIYSEARQGGFPVNVVNDTQEYGLMADTDAEFIAATDPQTVLALIARVREAEERVEAEKRWPLADMPPSGVHRVGLYGERDGFIQGYIAGATRPVTDAEVRAVAPFVHELLQTDQPVTQRDVDSAVRASLEAARREQA